MMNMSGKCDFEHVARAICKVHNFIYERFIDSGSYKETYQVKSGEDYFALKIFRPNNSSERTDREIDAMRRAICPNIARLIDVDDFIMNGDTFLYLLEEYFAGGALGTRLKTSLLSKSEIITLGEDLITAFEVTYKERIVHRDVKPDNIMFRVDTAEAVLIDFGLVRDLDASSLTQTFHMRGPGTPIYSAPEQLNNEKNMIDWRTDQFSLGITICEAAFGEHPFDAGSSAKTVERIATRATCNKTTAGKLLNLGLAPVIKMFEPYPIGRYRTPGLLRDDWSKMGGEK